jgi:hypothetical protein
LVKFRDSFFFKLILALDLQDCGITTIGANHLLEGLKFNAMMHVLDVRLNPKIDRDTLQKIMEQVMINSSGKETEVSLCSSLLCTFKSFFDFI